MALRDVGRGIIEIALSSGGMNLIDDADLDLLRLLTRESGRPVTWLALFARPGEPDFHHTQTVAKLGDLLGQAIPQITPRPIMTQGDLRNPSVFASFLTWQPALNRPVAEQIALYQQPEFREAFRAGIAQPQTGSYLGANAGAGSPQPSPGRPTVARPSRRSLTCKASSR